MLLAARRSIARALNILDSKAATMQATSRPWSWGEGGSGGRRRRVRLQLQAVPLDLRRLPPPRPLDWRLRPDLAAVAALYPNQPIRHLIRWENLGPSATMQPPFGYPRDPSFPWLLHDIANRISLEPRPSISPAVSMVGRGVAAGAGAGAGGGAGWWEGAGRGLPLGAALLAALLLLVRLVDKCFANNLFNKFAGRRRQSEEWPTPNVMATSLAARMTGEGPTRPESPEEARGVPDPPPPYSECAAAAAAGSAAAADAAVRAPKREEPPPPYSACYVSYAAPARGAPDGAVTLHTGAGAQPRRYFHDGSGVQVSESGSEQENGTFLGATNHRIARADSDADTDLPDETLGADLRVHLPEQPLRADLRVNLPETAGDRFLLV